jgi:hypothetical protein
MRFRVLQIFLMALAFAAWGIRAQAGLHTPDFPNGSLGSHLKTAIKQDFDLGDEAKVRGAVQLPTHAQSELRLREISALWTEVRPGKMLTDEIEEIIKTGVMSEKFMADSKELRARLKVMRFFCESLCTEETQLIELDQLTKAIGHLNDDGKPGFGSKEQISSTAAQLRKAMSKAKLEAIDSELSAMAPIEAKDLAKRIEAEIQAIRKSIYAEGLSETEFYEVRKSIGRLQTVLLSNALSESGSVQEKSTYQAFRDLYDQIGGAHDAMVKLEPHGVEVGRVSFSDAQRLQVEAVLHYFEKNEAIKPGKPPKGAKNFSIRSLRPVHPLRLLRAMSSLLESEDPGAGLSGDRELALSATEFPSSVVAKPSLASGPRGRNMATLSVRELSGIFTPASNPEALRQMYTGVHDTLASLSEDPALTGIRKAQIRKALALLEAPGATINNVGFQARTDLYRLAYTARRESSMAKGPEEVATQANSVLQDFERLVRTADGAPVRVASDPMVRDAVAAGIREIEKIPVDLFSPEASKFAAKREALFVKGFERSIAAAGRADLSGLGKAFARICSAGANCGKASERVAISANDLFRAATAAVIKTTTDLRLAGAVVMSTDSIEKDFTTAAMLRASGALGPNGVLGWASPANKLGPTGWFGASPMISGIDWSGDASKMVDGPLLSEYGVFGAHGAVGTAYRDGAFAAYREGSPLMALGPKGPLGVYGALGALGEVGATGFKLDAKTGAFTKDGKVVTEALVREENGLVMRDLVEHYQPDYARALSQRGELGGSFKIDDKLRPGESRELTLQVKANTWITYAVSSDDGAFGRVGLKLKSEDGVVLAEAKSRENVNFISMRVPKDGVIKVEVSNFSAIPYSPYNPFDLRSHGVTFHATEAPADASVHDFRASHLTTYTLDRASSGSDCNSQFQKLIGAKSKD